MLKYLLKKWLTDQVVEETEAEKAARKQNRGIQAAYDQKY